MLHILSSHNLIVEPVIVFDQQRDLTRTLEFTNIYVENVLIRIWLMYQVILTR